MGTHPQFPAGWSGRLLAGGSHRLRFADGMAGKSGRRLVHQAEARKAVCVSPPQDYGGHGKRIGESMSPDVLIVSRRPTPEATNRESTDFRDRCRWCTLE